MLHQRWSGVGLSIEPVHGENENRATVIKDGSKRMNKL